MIETHPKQVPLVSLDPATLAEFRRRAARSAGDVTFVELEAIARPLLGPSWLSELRAILAPFKPKTIGGAKTSAPLHRTATKKWKVADAVPPWVSPLLPRLPELALARHRARLAEAEAEVVAWRRAMNEVEATLEDALREAVRAAVPRYWQPPERLPPPPRNPATRERNWPEVSQEEIEAAEDAGSLSAGIAQGGDDDPVPRPDHPILADAWDRGWVDRYDFVIANYEAVMAKEGLR